MPFTSLLLTALVQEESIKEDMVTIKVPKPDANEKLLLFAADRSHHFHREFLKRTQPDKSEPSCCDIICFRRTKVEKQNPKVVICLIELKGGKADQTSKAVDQILKTYEGMKAGILGQNIDMKNITWKAVIISNSSLPNKEIDEKLGYLKKIFTLKNVVHVHKKSGVFDLQDIMRQ